MEIPVLASRDGPVLLRRVPTEWYDHVREVRQRRQALEHSLLQTEGVAGVKVVPSAERYGGLRGLELTVELNHDIRWLPDEVRGTRMGTELAMQRGLGGCFNTSSFEPVPGGVMIEPVAGDHFGTACCRVFDGGDRRLLTAAHLWNTCGSNVEGDSLYQSGRRVGDVVSFHRGYDVAVVDPVDGVRLADSIELTNERQLPVAGYVTEWGIGLFLAEGEAVLDMGVSSGLTDGRLTAVYVEEGWNHCIDFAGHGIEADYRNAEGDSGGPVFYRHEGEAYLVASQQMWLDRLGTECGEDNVLGGRGRGTAAYHLNDDLDIAFSS